MTDEKIVAAGLVALLGEGGRRTQTLKQALYEHFLKEDFSRTPIKVQLVRDNDQAGIFIGSNPSIWSNYIEGAIKQFEFIPIEPPKPGHNPASSGPYCAICPLKKSDS